MALADITIPPEPRPGCPHQEAGKCFQLGLGFTHARPQWRPHGFRPCGQSPSNMFPSAQFKSAIACPTVTVLPNAHIAVHIQVSKWRAWQADGTCMIDVPTLAEVSTQPCKAEKDPLPWMLHVQSTWYKERSAGRGMGTHMAHNPHRRAEVFGALLKIASGPWPVNVAFVLGCQASSPPSVPVYPGGMFPRWYHNHVAAIEKMFWAHNNLVYNLTIFRWTRCPTAGSGAGKHPDTAP